MAYRDVCLARRLRISVADLGGPMLRVEMQDSENALMVRLEGRFTGDGAEDVRMLVSRCNTEKRLVVDLTEVTFVDSIGEAALAFFRRLGAKFVAEDAYTLDVCERLHLPLTRNGKWREAAPQLKVPGIVKRG
jgi:hypothetical protein